MKDYDDDDFDAPRSAPTRAPSSSEWEDVRGVRVQRMEVPGGWIYRHSDGGMVFVPRPDIPWQDAPRPAVKDFIDGVEFVRKPPRM